MMWKLAGSRSRDVKRSISTKWSQALCLQASLHLVDILNSSNLCSCTLRISNAILALMTITFEIFFILFLKLILGIALKCQIITYLTIWHPKYVW